MQPPSVLIADDSRDMREMTSLLLRKAGFTVHTSSAGDEALDVIGREHISVVLADIHMPGNERLELVDTIARRFPGLPVVLMTGEPSMETAIASANSPVVAYLLKPVPAETLLRAVQRAAGVHEARHALAASQQHLRAWEDDLRRLERLMGDARTATEANGPRTFLDLSLSHVSTALSNLRDVVDTLAASPGGTQNLRNLEIQQALKDAIHVLNRTRTSFKSKELGDLRERLESLVQNYGL
jgi:FixJ family two-component response regulator